MHSHYLFLNQVDTLVYFYIHKLYQCTSLNIKNINLVEEIAAQSYKK